MTDISVDDERGAREWARKVVETCRDDIPAATAARTILALLDRPVMPRGEDVPHKVAAQMLKAHFDAECGYRGLRAAIDVLHAHLTAPPKPTRIERWGVLLADGVWHASYPTKTHAEGVAACRRGSRVVRLVEAADADQ